MVFECLVFFKKNVEKAKNSEVPHLSISQRKGSVFPCVIILRPVFSPAVSVVARESVSGGPQKVRRGPGKQRQKSNANDSLYEDVDDEDQYCAIDYDQIRNYEYGYAQYGSQYGGPQYGGPPGGQVDAQQLLMMQQQQQQQIYRQQQSRTNTLGSTRSDGGGAGVYQRVPTQAPGMSGGGPVYQPINSQDSDVGASRHTVDAMQMDNMKRSGSPALLNGGGKMNAAATPLGPKSTPLMARGPTRAPPPPPTQTGPSNDEDYLSPVTSNTSNV